MGKNRNLNELDMLLKPKSNSVSNSLFYSNLEKKINEWIINMKRGLSNYFDDEDIKYIQDNMILTTNSFTRVESESSTFNNNTKQLEIGDIVPFNKPLNSFSKTQQASKDYIELMEWDTDSLVIYRTNGVTKHYNIEHG